MPPPIHAYTIKVGFEPRAFSPCSSQLQKIDRVSFGLLKMSEYERLVKSEPHMPRSRFKLAIPFVGKDVPSVS